MNIKNQQQNETPVLARQDQQPSQYVTPLADVESTEKVIRSMRKCQASINPAWKSPSTMAN